MDRKFTLSIWTLAHFCVDFACIFSLQRQKLAGAGGWDIALYFIVYNVIAFGMQPFIGYLCDRRRNIPIGLIGACMTALGVFALPLPTLSLLLVSFGNACFHVGGGIDSLRHAGGRIARSGVFVSSGAVGVSLGLLLGAMPGMMWFLPLPGLLLCVLFIALFCRERPMSAQTGIIGLTTADDTPAFALDNPGRGFWAVIGLCCLSIVIRAFVGTAVPIPWKTTVFLTLLPGIAAMLGKAAGGFLADRFGARRVGVLSLLFSLPCLTLGTAHPVTCAIGLVLFNMSMSITLCTIVSRLPMFPGLGFGLTTLALLAGSMPAFFIALDVPPAATGILIALSAVCIGLVSRNRAVPDSSAAEDTPLATHERVFRDL